jgi:UDPglucose 6-dehydrogenase
MTDAVAVVDDPLLVAKDADVLVVLTEWPEFRSLDWPAVAGVLGRRVVVDTRNLLDPDVLRRAGISWVGVGRR